MFDFSDVGFGRAGAGNEGEGGALGEGGANEFWRVSAGEDADDKPDEGVGE